MGWSGGSFSRTNGSNTGTTVWQQDQAGAVDIEADRHDTHDQDLADGINACLHKGGQNAMTANLDLGGYVFDNASGSFNFTKTDAVDLVDNGNALNIGTLAGGHLAFGVDTIQAKDSATSAGLLLLNPNGGQVNVGDPVAAADTVFVVNAATGQDSLVRFQENSVTQGAIYNDASANIMHFQVLGSSLAYQWDDGTNISAQFTPTGAQTLRYANDVVFATRSGGVSITSDGTDALIDFYDSGSTQGGYLRYFDASGNIELVSKYPNSGTISLKADDTGGTETNLLVGDPDGALTGYYDGTATLRTASYTGTDEVSGADVLDGGGTFRPVGFNTMPINSVTSATTLSDNYAGHMMRITSGTGDIDITTAASGACPAGTTWMVSNHSGSNNAIDANTGVTLNWLDGGGGATGDRTLADGGVCTIVHVGSNVFDIWGSGLT